MGVLGLDITTTPVGPDALLVDVRLPPPSRNWTTRIVTADSSRVQATRYQSRGFTRAADRTDTVPEAPLTRHPGRRPSTSNLYCAASSYSPRCNTLLPLSARVPSDSFRSLRSAPKLNRAVPGLSWSGDPSLVIRSTARGGLEDPLKAGNRRASPGPWPVTRVASPPSSVTTRAVTSAEPRFVTEPGERPVASEPESKVIQTSSAGAPTAIGPPNRARLTASRKTPKEMRICDANPTVATKGAKHSFRATTRRQVRRNRS